MRREPKEGYVLMRDGRLITLAEFHLRRAAKLKRRKGRYMRYFSHWESRHQSTKKLAACRSRRQRIDVDA